MTRLVPALLALLVACAGEAEPPAARSPTPTVTAVPTTPVPAETTPTPDETTPEEEETMPDGEVGEPILIETRVAVADPEQPLEGRGGQRRVRRAARAGLDGGEIRGGRPSGSGTFTGKVIR